VLVCKYCAAGELQLLYVRQGILHLETVNNNTRTAIRQFNHQEELQVDSIIDFLSVNSSYFFLTSPRISVSMCLAGTDNIVLAKFE